MDSSFAFNYMGRKYYYVQTHVAHPLKNPKKTLSRFVTLDYLGVISFSSAFELVLPGQ